MTILGPILFGALFILPAWLATKDSEDVRTIEVKDDSGLFEDAFEDSRNLRFTYTNLNLQEAKAQLEYSQSFGLLYIPEIDIQNPKDITLFSESSPGLELKGQLEYILAQKIQERKLEVSQISKETLEALYRGNHNFNNSI